MDTDFKMAIKSFTHRTDFLWKKTHKKNSYNLATCKTDNNSLFLTVSPVVSCPGPTCVAIMSPALHHSARDTAFHTFCLKIRQKKRGNLSDKPHIIRQTAILRNSFRVAVSLSLSGGAFVLIVSALNTLAWRPNANPIMA